MRVREFTKNYAIANPGSGGEDTLYSEWIIAAGFFGSEIKVVEFESGLELSEVLGDLKANEALVWWSDEKEITIYTVDNSGLLMTNLVINHDGVTKYRYTDLATVFVEDMKDGDSVCNDCKELEQ